MAPLALVTGASSGIGKATALGLAKQNLKVIIISKNKEKGQSALDEIKLKSQNANVELLIADLSSQQSIHSLTNKLKKDYQRLDILVHCAGVLQKKRLLTVDNIETTFAVNHLAPFLLTLNLMNLLKSSPQARIITITSRAEELGKMDLNRLNGEETYYPFKNYCQSKLANILFTYALAHRLQNTKITANCIHPGFVKSELGRHLNIVMRGLIWLMQPLMATPAAASKAIIRLAIDPAFNETNGKYFIGHTESRSSKQSYDHSLADDLWKMSETLTYSSA